LRAVFAYEGFPDERPHGPDADEDLGQVFWPLRHSVEKLDLAILSDRASLRMFVNPQDFVWHGFTGLYVEDYLDGFLGMWERCLEGAQEQDKLERSKAMRQKFKNLWSHGISPFGDQEIAEVLET
jgi:hypothetical protein